MENKGGIIAISSAFLGRYREFDVCVSEVEAPSGSLITYKLGINVARNFNQCIRAMLDKGLEWVWMLGDDHVFSKDLLTKLLDRDVDVIAPLCMRRSEPVVPIIGNKDNVDFTFGKAGVVQLPEGAYCGNAGMLVRRSVFERMKDPWMEQGKINPETSGYDIYWCQKLHAAGIPIHLDLDNLIGHMTHVTIWPSRNEKGQWGYQFKLHGADNAYAVKQAQKVNYGKIFDTWRENYDKLSYKKHQQFYSMIAKQFPNQQQVNLNATKAFFLLLFSRNYISNVLELGGWNGRGGKYILSTHLEVKKWHNIEICKEALTGKLQEGYTEEVLPDFFWKVKPYVSSYNVLYLSHVVEHMTYMNFKSILCQIDSHIKYIYLDVPIPLDISPNWYGYKGTHIFEFGWNVLHNVLKSHGYKLNTEFTETCRSYIKQE